MVETATTVQFYLSLMPYLSCPAPDITYHLIKTSPIGTGEQLLDSLSINKKRKKVVGIQNLWTRLAKARDETNQNFLDTVLLRSNQTLAFRYVLNSILRVAIKSSQSASPLS